jgi:hypothetical protein
VPTPPIILAEGPADEQFVRELIKARNLPRCDIQKANPPEAYGQPGFAKRLEGLKLAVGLSARKAVVIIADNDDDPSASFAFVRSQISAVGDYGIPTKPREAAASTNPNLPPLVVLMIPWDNESGCLDTICFAAADNMRPKIGKCVRKFVKCVKPKRWPVSPLSKLKMRCLLSAVCKQDPNTPLQHAWSTSRGRPGDIIPLNDTRFDHIADFFATL